MPRGSDSDALDTTKKPPAANNLLRRRINTKKPDKSQTILVGDPSDDLSDETISDETIREINEKGNFHNEKGPAIIYPNGDKEFWLDGVKKEEHFKKNPSGNITKLTIKKFDDNDQTASWRTEERIIENGKRPVVVIKTSENYPSGGVDFAEGATTLIRDGDILEKWQESPWGTMDMTRSLGDQVLAREIWLKDCLVAEEDQEGNIDTYQLVLEGSKDSHEELDHFSYQGSDSQGDLFEVQEPSFLPSASSVTLRATKGDILKEGYQEDILSSSEIEVLVSSFPDGQVHYKDNVPQLVVDKDGNQHDIKTKHKKIDDGSFVRVLDTTAEGILTGDSANYILGENIANPDEVVSLDVVQERIKKSADAIVNSQEHIEHEKRGKKENQEKKGRLEEISRAVEKDVVDYQKNQGFFSRLQNINRNHKEKEAQEYQNQKITDLLEKEGLEPTEAKRREHNNNLDEYLDSLIKSFSNERPFDDRIKKHQANIKKEEEYKEKIIAKSKKIGIIL